MSTIVKISAGLGLAAAATGLLVSRVDGIWALAGYVSLVMAVFLLSVPAIAVLAPLPTNNRHH